MSPSISNRAYQVVLGETETMKKVYWMSRHELSLAQAEAISALHGGVEVIRDPAVLSGTEALTDYIREHADGFVYAVAGPPHYIAAALSGVNFGVFENHPGKRADGQFGLAAVYHVGSGKLEKVWVNPDPTSDHGEALIAVR